MIAYVKRWTERSRENFSHDITDPVERKRSAFYMRWFDHEILRIRWHNFAEVAPGVYRSNHPTAARFADYHQRGIRTILNLRGAANNAPYYFEAETCAALGIALVDIPLSARRAPRRETLLQVIDVMADLPKPFLMHCKSGADRTGLVAAIYLLTVRGKPLAEAKAQLSFRFLHIKFTKTGILDYVLHMYAERQYAGAIGFRDWVAQEYDPAAATEGFSRMGFWQRIRL